MAVFYHLLTPWTGALHGLIYALRSSQCSNTSSQTTLKNKIVEKKIQQCNNTVFKYQHWYTAVSQLVFYHCTFANIDSKWWRMFLFFGGEHNPVLPPWHQHAWMLVSKPLSRQKTITAAISRLDELWKVLFPGNCPTIAEQYEADLLLWRFVSLKQEANQNTGICMGMSRHIDMVALLL